MKSVFCFALFIVSFVQAQVTLRVTSLPANTPANATLYVAGSFNNWNAGDPNYILQPDGFGAWQITLPAGSGTVSYKFTRGSWATVEGNSSGGFLPNRSFTHTGVLQTLNLSILTWEDLDGTNLSTAAANVQLLDAAFFIPQLNRTRKIWLYLPPDYFTSTKTYPVLYMQDGQNLFDQSTSFSGEWQVDETLNALHAQGDYGAIVVGIENGGANRLNEYSPWNNPSFGGGEGEAYMEFVATVLKPYLDTHFRTKPQPAYTALIGSSMGAFIATYGMVRFPETFNKLGSFSPAYWFSLNNMAATITTTTADLQAMRIYFVAGQNESASMVANVQTIRNAFWAKGVTDSNTVTKIDSYGTHTESYWRGEFAAAYQWLFSGTNLSETAWTSSSFQWQYHQNGLLLVQGLEVPTTLELYCITGQKVGEQIVTNGENQLQLPTSKGMYILKLGAETQKIIR